MIGVWSVLLFFKAFNLSNVSTYIEFILAITTFLIILASPIVMIFCIRYFYKTRNERFREQYDSMWNGLNLQKLG